MISLGIANLPPTGREQRNYSDAITEALINRAAGESGPITPSVAAGVAAVQGGAALYSLAFAGAEIDPQDRITESLTPAVLADMARATVVYGESFYLVEVSRRDGSVELCPMSGTTVNGTSASRMSWTYEAQINSPDSTRTGRYPAARVVHIQWGYDASRPWIGVSPLQRSMLSAELLAGIERGLRAELSREPRYVLPIPSEPSRDDYTTWAKDLRAAKGGSMVIGKTMMGAASAGIGSSPQRDFGQRRLGPEPNRDTIDLRSQVAAHCLMAMGVDPALSNPDPKTGALQAAYRSFLTGSAASLGRIMVRELRAKLERPIRIRFAADVDNRRIRAAATKALVDAGMDLDRAVSLAGLDFD